MKYIYLSLIAFLFTSCQEAQSDQTNQDKAPVEVVTYYGQEINQEGISNYAEMKSATMETGLSKTKLEGTIVQTCPKKGCWMSLATATDTLFVRFRDYGFFVPTDSVSGKVAVIEGDLFLDTITVEMRKHYAEDAGKSEEEIAAITEPEYDINFIADGVIIKD